MKAAVKKDLTVVRSTYEVGTDASVPSPASSLLKARKSWRSAGVEVDFFNWFALMRVFRRICEASEFRTRGEAARRSDLT